MAQFETELYAIYSVFPAGSLKQQGARVAAADFVLPLLLRHLEIRIILRVQEESTEEV